ncbi:MAG: helix-turn-helix domain-containing protein [Planctomycetota bacterium]
MREDKVISEIMTLQEAAQYIRVSNKTLGEMARKRLVPSQKVGREWRFLRGALEDWLAGRVEAKSGPNSAGTVAEPEVQYEMPFVGLRDTAFTENRERTMHRWVPWIAGFSAGFVDGILQKEGRTKKRLTVLDPFAGVGTTLVEALKYGHDAFGFEINPYAALACRAKVSAVDYDIAVLEQRIAAFHEYGDKALSENAGPSRSSPPEGFCSRVPFFSVAVERQVLACLDFISDQEVEWVRDLFRMAFGSVMVSFSNYSYEPSLGTRAAAGKPNVEDADVFGIVGRKIEDMREDIVVFQSWLAGFKRPPKAAVFTDSYLDAASSMRRRSIDVLITSPPYLNNYHYIRNTRPHMYWLGMVQSPADLKEMEQRSFGQFWQTVRSGPEVPLRPKLKELCDLIECLKEQNVEKGTYGGQGWANYAAAYFNDCQRFCAVTRDVLKPGGAAVVVIGNNILQGVEFPTDQIFADIARQEGFEIVDLHEVRKKRTGNSIVNSSVRSGTVKKRTQLYETAVEMRASG